MSASPIDVNQQLPTSKDAASSEFTSLPGPPRLNSPHPSEVQMTAPDTSPSTEPKPCFINSQDASISSFTSAASNSSLGPLVRPLDLSTVILSPETIHVELARIVDDLRQWLSIVEAGLIGVLDKVNEDTIEEEQEDVAADIDDESQYEDFVEYSEDTVDREGETTTLTLAAKN
jgi:hypothetical protein